jgi:hypothetical protein
LICRFVAWVGPLETPPVSKQAGSSSRQESIVWARRSSSGCWYRRRAWLRGWASNNWLPALVEWVEAERDRLADLLVAAAAAELDQAFAH